MYVYIYIYIQYTACWEASSLQIYGIMGILMVGIHIKSMANPDIHKIWEQKVVQPPNPVWFLPTKWILEVAEIPPIFRGLSSSSSCLGTTKLNETWIASCEGRCFRWFLGERRRTGWKKNIRKMLKPAGRH